MSENAGGMSVGNAMLDTGRGQIIRLIGEVKGAINAANYAALGKIFLGIKFCMERHFQNEELFAHSLRIPFNEHRMDHENILACVDIIVHELCKQDKTCNFVSHYLEYLDNRLAAHFNEHDLQMKPLLQKYPYERKVVGAFIDD